MSISQVYPGFLVITVMMLTGYVIARGWPFYREMIKPHPRARYETLDGLRGFLAVGVFVHHSVLTYLFFTSGDWVMRNNPAFDLFGQVAVAMFFMITGFLFWGKVLAGDGRLDLVHHFRGRAFRLIPLYALLATLATIITIVRIWPIHGSAFFEFTKLVARIYALGLVSWGSWGTFNPGGIVAGVTWTLKYEWVFYCLLPIFALFRKPRWLVLFTALYFAEFFATKPWRSDLGPAVNLLGGMICAQLMRWPTVDRFPWKSAAVSLLSLAFLFAMPLILSENYAIFIFPMTLFIFIAVVKGNNFFGLLMLKGPRMTGVASYSIYLLHGMLLFLSRPLLRQIALHHGVPLYWLTIGGLGILVVIVSSLSYRLIEHPFIEMERRRKQSSTSSAVPGAAETMARTEKASVLSPITSSAEPKPQA